MAEESIAYDRQEFNLIKKSFKAMDDVATKIAQETAFELAQFAAAEIRKAAYTRYVNPAAVRKIADGV